MQKTKTAVIAVMGAMLVASMLPAPAAAHCQIPCGIFDDPMRLAMLDEHIVTIEKSIDQIVLLSAAEEKDYNQIVRWVTNKDDHADQFIDIVADYFLAQRIKPVEATEAAAYAEYTKSVVLLHQMTVYAMKCKQSLDKANVEKLKKLTAEFKDIYIKK